MTKQFCTLILLVAFSSAQGFIENKISDTWERDAKEFQTPGGIMKTIEELKDIVNVQQDQIAYLIYSERTQEERIALLINNVTIQTQQIAEISEANAAQERMILNMTSTIRELEQSSLKEALPKIKTNGQLTDYVNTAFGCLDDTISMYCMTDGTINVTGAILGQYPECSDCCTPNLGTDCIEDIIVKNVEELVVIKLKCDNKTTCDYVYDGAAMAGCDENSIADYMQISYDCLSETEVNAPVGFTAYTISNRYYAEGEKIIFEEVLSNFGSFYNNANGIFTCPFDGIYIFVLDLMNEDRLSVKAKLELDGATLIEVWSPYAGDEYNQGSGTCITMCRVGQIVDVELVEEGQFIGQDRRSHFSGFLLQRY